MAIAIGAALASTCGAPKAARAEVAVDQQTTDAGTLVVYRLTVTPAPEPTPPLRHRLAVREIELQPGNAATHYLRAFPEGGFEGKLKRMVDKYGEAFHDWYSLSEVPLKALPLDKAREAAASFDGVIDHFIAPATLRRQCDWGWGIEDMRGPEIFEFLLPEINASRSVSRVLALRARVAIAEGDYDRAIDQLRMNYRLGQHVGSQPLLVCGLVGIAEASIANQQVIELMGAKDSPNLYWALAELPQPMVSIRKAVQFEMSMGMRIFPFLLDAETANHAPQEWARMMAQAMSEVGRLSDADAGPNRVPFELRQSAVAALSLPMYPAAKQRLIESGMDAGQVEAMPVGQVIAVDAAREYRRVADEIEKSMYIPYHVARQRELQVLFVDPPMAAVWRGYGYVLARLLLPAVEAARSAETRLEWQMHALQVIEALRMHAAQSGSLPVSLDEIQLVPVPSNPATNQPYQYHLDGKTAVLELPFSDGFSGIAWRFEITLAGVD
jgi:hypothetical protein